MDVYDGRRFQIPIDQHAQPLRALLHQRNYHGCRGIGAVSVAAKAIGDEDNALKLYKLGIELFDEYGQIDSALTNDF